MKTFESFIDEISVDGREVMREAIVWARHEIKRERRLFDIRQSPLCSIARDALQYAKARDRSRAWNKAGVLYMAQFDPVTREISCIETRLCVLRNRILGKIGYARRHCQDEINSLTARLCDLRGRTQFLEAAE